MKVMEDTSGKLVWFLAGASLGATIALLYAPQSGRETRRIIKKKSREGREAISESSRDLMEKGRDLYEKGLKVADDAAEMIERGRRLVEG
jgi:gas vesicle protein